jgi:hypothetical protein
VLLAQGLHLLAAGRDQLPGQQGERLQRREEGLAPQVIGVLDTEQPGRQRRDQLGEGAPGYRACKAQLTQQAEQVGQGPVADAWQQQLSRVAPRADQPGLGGRRE